MQSSSWQQQLAQAIRHPKELLNHVGLLPDSIGYSDAAIEQFPVLVPYAFANRIQRNNPDDPLLRQVFPYKEEELEDDGFSYDPLNEVNVQPVHGLLQKYKSRVLSITTGACAIHCRYCFRRHFPYADSLASKSHWQKSLEFIANDKSIEEIILSGGDPLTLSDDRIVDLCQSLSELKQIKRIRFHTRIPVVLPDRIDDSLVERLSTLGKTFLFILHVNHANEIDEKVEESINLLQRYNILVLNQSVLLKGINDCVEELIKLSERLVDNNVIPYYLHLMDPVAGATHYNVNIEKARSLLEIMNNRVSGYLVPKLVKEEIGGKSKILIRV